MLKYKLKFCNNLYGLEIGGPSATGHVLYEKVFSMDNAVFSYNTVWNNSSEIYNFYPNKTGKVIINDATELKDISNEKYDFIFASHCLEHIANPLKALYEWIRVIKNDGHIVLILPEKSCCFDHKRNISLFTTLLRQYENNVDESDLSTLPEILLNHDIALDPPAQNLEYFTERSLNNLYNRCLHHYVYDYKLLLEICNHLNCEFIYTETQDINIWFIIKKNNKTREENKEKNERVFNCLMKIMKNAQS